MLQVRVQRWPPGLLECAGAVGRARSAVLHAFGGAGGCCRGIHLGSKGMGGGMYVQVRPARYGLLGTGYCRREVPARVRVPDGALSAQCRLHGASASRRVTRRPQRHDSRAASTGCCRGYSGHPLAPCRSRPPVRPGPICTGSHCGRARRRYKRRVLGTCSGSLFHGRRCEELCMKGGVQGQDANRICRPPPMARMYLYGAHAIRIRHMFSDPWLLVLGAWSFYTWRHIGTYLPGIGTRTNTSDSADRQQKKKGISPLHCNARTSSCSETKPAWPG